MTTEHNKIDLDRTLDNDPEARDIIKGAEAHARKLNFPVIFTDIAARFETKSWLSTIFLIMVHNNRPYAQLSGPPDVDKEQVKDLVRFHVIDGKHYVEPTEMLLGRLRSNLERTAVEDNETYTAHVRLKYAHNILRNGWHQVAECTKYRATKAAESGYNLVISENERAINAKFYPGTVYSGGRVAMASLFKASFRVMGGIAGLGKGVGIAISSIPLAVNQLVRPSKPSSSNLLHRPQGS
jgi:hypothetical protein